MARLEEVGGGERSIRTGAMFYRWH